jgi:hypothetical protein
LGLDIWHHTANLPVFVEEIVVYRDLAFRHVTQHIPVEARVVQASSLRKTILSTLGSAICISLTEINFQESSTFSTTMVQSATRAEIAPTAANTGKSMAPTTPSDKVQRTWLTPVQRPT